MSSLQWLITFTDPYRSWEDIGSYGNFTQALQDLGLPARYTEEDLEDGEPDDIYTLTVTFSRPVRLCLFDVTAAIDSFEQYLSLDLSQIRLYPVSCQVASAA